MDTEQKIKLVNRLVAGTAIFATMVAIILLLNYYQTSKLDPVESGVIGALVERLDQEPNNEALKLEIRQLDLLARKAYFTSAWQVRTGGFILLFAGILLGILLKILYDLKASIKEPDPEELDNQAARKNSTRWIWAIGGLVFIASLISAYITQDHLANYDDFKLAQLQAVESETASNEIEVVELGVGNEEPGIGNEDAGVGNEEPGIGSEEPGVGNRASGIGSEERDQGPGTTDHGPDPRALGPGSSQYPFFRGFMSNGVSFHKNIPVEWDGASGSNIIWKVAIPRHGYNSPIYWDNKLFLAGGDAEAREVFCYDRNTGEMLWQKLVTDVEGSPAKAPKVTSDTGLSAPTMATDGKKVFAIFGTGDIIAFDMNGNRVWARNLGVPDNHYGHSSSLICWDDKVIVLYDTNNGGKIMAVNVNDGKTMWQHKRNNRISWSSPVLAEIDDKMVILTTTDPLIAAHDLKTGEELWQVECLMGEVGASAAYGSGLVFGANEYARLVAIKPGAEPEIVWENDEYLPEVATPVESDGLLFIGTSYGVFACYNALTGEKFWEYEANQGFYASPIIADGKVYAIDMDGLMHIFALDKELKVIGVPKLGEKAVATPAFADGRIYIRGNNNLYCIGQK